MEIYLQFIRMDKIYRVYLAICNSKYIEIKIKNLGIIIIIQKPASWPVFDGYLHPLITREFIYTLSKLVSAIFVDFL